ncbi:MAG TPA: CDP-alcohol phosphatidyltransferase family protein [Geminicoccaceae bacterium]|nr:CDP-alcohol phosphatidyltransferase family protein [Geminicoccaceae bacterium]
MPRLASIDPPWDQRLARVLVRPLRNGRVTPNGITTLTLILGLLSAWLYARGGSAAHLGAVLFMLACLLDHADGELARLSGRTSTFGHYYDLIADGLVLTALFLGIGAGLSGGEAGAGALRLGLLAGGATGLIVLLRLELERRAGRSATRQPNLLGFELQDLMYLVGPVTWLGWLEPFLILAAIGAPLYALNVLWTLGRHLQRAGSPL